MSTNHFSKFRRLACLVVALSGLLATDALAQPPGRGGPGGPGGPDSPDLEIVKDFDADGDGVLNQQERAKARTSLKNRSQGVGRGGPGRGGPGRGGPGGPGGRGPRGPGGERPTGSVGPKVSPSDVENFPNAGFYDANVLRTLFLEFEQADWEQELADFKPTDVEVPATLTVDGKVYPNVGVSFRGASSFFMVPEGLKRSLNLSLDLVDDKQRLDGYKSLNLLNFNGDDSMMSSYLYSRIASKKMATPKVNFVKVVINGRSWGIYANSQQFNKEFLEENYGTRKGARWKVSGSPRGDAGLRYLGDDVSEYRSRFEIKSKDKDESWQDLIELCRVLNETPVSELESTLDPILDIDGALWFLAVDVALINSDGYWTRASDYSIYQDPNGKFHILPHDMNEAFRASRGGPGGGPGGRGPGGPGFGGPGSFFGGPPPERSGESGRGGPPQQFGPPQSGGRPPSQQEAGERRGQRGGDAQRGNRQGRRGQPGGDAQRGYELDPLVGLDQERFPLRSRLLANPALKQRYLQYVRMIAEDMIAWDKLGPQVKEAQELIDKEVKADTRKLTTYQSFQNATSQANNTPQRSLKEFSEKRSKYLLEYKEIKDFGVDRGK